MKVRITPWELILALSAAILLGHVENGGFAWWSLPVGLSVWLVTTLTQDRESR